MPGRRASVSWSPCPTPSLVPHRRRRVKLPLSKPRTLRTTTSANLPRRITDSTCQIVSLTQEALEACLTPAGGFFRVCVVPEDMEKQIPFPLPLGEGEGQGV